MSDYTPTLAEIRRRASTYCSQGGCGIDDDSNSRRLQAEFDRVIAEVQEKVWGEAVDCLSRHWEDHSPSAISDLERRNPYRAEAYRREGKE